MVAMPKGRERDWYGAGRGEGSSFKRNLLTLLEWPEMTVTGAVYYLLIVDERMSTGDIAAYRDIEPQSVYQTARRAEEKIKARDEGTHPYADM